MQKRCRARRATGSRHRCRNGISRDLYADPEVAEGGCDLDEARKRAKDLKDRYQGKIAGLGRDGEALAQALADYESLSDLIGRLGSYAGLLYAADTADSERAKFYGDIQERITAISSDLLFFELELNKIEDADLAAALQVPALAKYKPWIDDLRKEKPYQLDETLEKLFLEKAMTSRSAFDRLFNETMTGLRFEVAGEPVAFAAGADTQLPRQSRPLAARSGRQRRWPRSSRTTSGSSRSSPTRSPRTRRSPTAGAASRTSPTAGIWPTASRPTVVDALVASVRRAYPRLSHRYYALKAKWLGMQASGILGSQRAAARTARACHSLGRCGENGARRLRGFAPRDGRHRAQVLRRRLDRCAGARRQVAGRLLASDRAVGAPYILMNYQGKARDVMTLAHELGHGVHQVLAAPQGPLLARRR